MKKKNKKYGVTVDIKVVTVIEISAETFEEALIKAKDYDVKDVVKFDTDYVYGSVKITGVWED